jgi:hypothetical protein
VASIVISLRSAVALPAARFRRGRATIEALAAAGGRLLLGACGRRLRSSCGARVDATMTPD